MYGRVIRRFSQKLRIKKSSRIFSRVKRASVVIPTVENIEQLVIRRE